MDRQRVVEKVQQIVDQLTPNCGKRLALSLTHQLGDAVRDHPDILFFHRQNKRACVREAVAEAAGNLHDPSSPDQHLTAVLRSLLADPDEWVRLKARRGLYKPEGEAAARWESATGIEDLLWLLSGKVTKGQAERFLSRYAVPHDVIRQQVAAAVRPNPSQPWHDLAWFLRCEVARVWAQPGSAFGGWRETDWAREVFPPPHVRIRLDLRWRTEDVLRLARIVQQTPLTRREQMPRIDPMWVLADALEEAGCDQQDLLRHCRRSAYHPPTCWVLALLLEPEEEAP